MDILVGKQLVDTYCKRSSTLLEKVWILKTAMFICNLTLHVIGHGIRKVDGRIRGALHSKVGGLI
jgi:hypothetical protein